MSIALIGIVSLQFAMLKDSYIQKELLFDQNVNAALVDVVKKVEKAEAIDFINKKANHKTKMVVKSTSVYESESRNRKTDKGKVEIANKTAQRDLLKSIALLERKLSKLEKSRQLNDEKAHAADLRRITDSLHSLRNSFEFSITPKNYRVEIPNLTVFDDSVFSMSFSNGETNLVFSNDSLVSFITTPKAKVPRSRIESRSYSDREPPLPPLPPSAIDEHVFEHPIVSEYFDNPKKERIEVIQDLAAELDAQTLPLNKRVKSNLIDSLLKIELEKRGINLNYTVLITDYFNKIFYTTSLDDTIINRNYYTVSLFDNNGSKNYVKINVEFPNKDEMLSSEMGPTLGSSALLLIILVGCFMYTIYAILKQKKLSDLKNDFINNMTHEFKTPVSTIMLASEALKDPQVLNDEPRVKRLAGIIYDENLRLGEHVERVLNMARMDKGEIKLAMNSISLHTVIEEGLKHFDLNLANKSQKVITNFKAVDDLIYADEFHLKNIIQNLIDNASKYSMIGSTIFIETIDTKSEVVLKVRDQGIGMKREQIKKIFEPFYRVPTGNLHDVKGFGIGLHYVHSILKVMGGKIYVKSEVGLGSEFSVTFPKQAI